MVSIDQQDAFNGHQISSQTESVNQIHEIQHVPIHMKNDQIHEFRFHDPKT